MGSGGFILGGLLQGVGAGVVQDVAERRRIALENLRASNDAAAAEAKSARDLSSAKELAGVNAANKRDEIAQTAEAQRELEKDKTAGNIAEKRVQGQIDVMKIGVEYKSKAGLAKFQSQLDIQLAAAKNAGDTTRELAIESARAASNAGEVSSTTALEDGSYLLVYKDGSQTRTPKIGLPAKTQSAGDTPLPMARGDASAPATPAASTTSTPAPSAATGTRLPKIPKAKWDEYLAQAGTLQANGDARFKGLSPAQVKQKVRDMIRASGYAPPE